MPNVFSVNPAHLPVWDLAAVIVSAIDWAPLHFMQTALHSSSDGDSG